MRSIPLYDRLELRIMYQWPGNEKEIVMGTALFIIRFVTAHTMKGDAKGRRIRFIYPAHQGFAGIIFELSGVILKVAAGCFLLPFVFGEQNFVS